MAMIQWYLALVVAAAAGVVAVLAWRGSRDPKADDDVAYAANVRRLHALPRYKALLQQHLRTLLVFVVSLGVALAGAALLVGRLANVRYVDNTEKSRDIMLCLDVSSSMERVDKKILEAYEQIIKDFKGERVGLVAWDSSAVVVFPLTNDYQLVSERLSEGRRTISDYNGLLQLGTSFGAGSSIIGDGLATCVHRFDRLDEDRPRTIVLATDNQINGKPVYTLSEAMNEAVDRKITVLSIAPDEHGNEIKALRSESERTGGGLFVVKHSGTASDIRSRIDAMERKSIPLPPARIVQDLPLAGGLLALLGVAGTIYADRRRQQ